MEIREFLHILEIVNKKKKAALSEKLEADKNMGIHSPMPNAVGHGTPTASSVELAAERQERAYMRWVYVLSMRVDMISILHEIIRKLDPLEQALLLRRYGSGQNIPQAAKEMGFSSSYAYTLQRKAIKNLSGVEIDFDPTAYKIWNMERPNQFYTHEWP